MPTYDYECSACGAVFEVFQSMTAEPLQKCEKCGETGKVRRLIGTGAGIIFKGSGFYVTDYCRKSAPCCEQPKPADAKAGSACPSGGDCSGCKKADE
ncbi:MAG: FmdB family zinc ribbon protein [Candidatus Omnitrophota bacterium]|jgi:putative FmdB family regulatory protein